MFKLPPLLGTAFYAIAAAKFVVRVFFWLFKKIAETIIHMILEMIVEHVWHAVHGYEVMMQVIHETILVLI